MTNVLSQEGQVAYLQDGEFIQFVQKEGAEEIKRSAVANGYEVEDYNLFFNVVYVKGIRLDD